jgi:hypothetical protein
MSCSGVMHAVTLTTVSQGFSVYACVVMWVGHALRQAIRCSAAGAIRPRICLPCVLSKQSSMLSLVHASMFAGPRAHGVCPAAENGVFSQFGRCCSSWDLR